jgi:hypothetical protein
MLSLEDCIALCGLTEDEVLCDSAPQAAAHLERDQIPAVTVDLTHVSRAKRARGQHGARWRHDSP